MKTTGFYTALALAIFSQQFGVNAQDYGVAGDNGFGGMCCGRHVENGAYPLFAGGQCRGWWSCCLEKSDWNHCDDPNFPVGRSNLYVQYGYCANGGAKRWEG
ncbi:hypothetical protein PTMSG1_02350 [Pyrenophora teres f. maculata]|nr:hypothetical protein PTMSG1_02350 [Pyrenophora teres f. maculata]